MRQVSQPNLDFNGGSSAIASRGRQRASIAHEYATQSKPNSGQGAQGSPIRLKALTNPANGGIGVSYSNVVLAGGLDPRKEGLHMKSSYKQTIGGGQTSPYVTPVYNRGLEFNAKQKYDYNILNGQSLGQSQAAGPIMASPARPSGQAGPVLQQAASQMLLQ